LEWRQKRSANWCKNGFSCRGKIKGGKKSVLETSRSHATEGGETERDFHKKRPGISILRKVVWKREKTTRGGGRNLKSWRKQKTEAGEIGHRTGGYEGVKSFIEKGGQHTGTVRSHGGLEMVEHRR